MFPNPCCSRFCIKAWRVAEQSFAPMLLGVRAPARAADVSGGGRVGGVDDLGKGDDAAVADEDIADFAVDPVGGIVDLAAAQAR